jgi:hypothetical protein
MGSIEWYVLIGLLLYIAFTVHDIKKQVSKIVGDA